MFKRLRDWLMGTTAAPPLGEPDPPAHVGMRIAPAARITAQVPPTAPNDQFMARPVPLKGVVPAQIAMDSYGTPANLPAITALAAYAYQSLAHEGLGFLGYPYLAELAQRAEDRHVAEIWAEHMTRRWVRLRGPNEERLQQIRDELDRLDVRGVFRTALEKDGLFGRSQIYLDTGSRETELSAMLLVRPEKINPRRPLRRLAVIEPIWSYPGNYEAADPLHPDFYRPRHWYIYGRTIHETRLLTLVGHEVPDMLKPAYAFGGLSATQLAKPYVDNWLRTRQSVSDITSAFSQMVLSTDMSAVLNGGAADDLYARADMFNRTRDNRGLMLLDKDTEELTNVSVPLSTLDKLQSQAQEQLASVARIPLSIYLQITPTGLNASSDPEIRSFYADVKAKQERMCRSPFQRILECVQLSLDGTIDPAVKFDFEDLWELSDVDRAAVRKTEAETHAAYVEMGAVDNAEVREKLREEDRGLYQGVNLDGDPPEPENEDDADGTEPGNLDERDEQGPDRARGPAG